MVLLIAVFAFYLVYPIAQVILNSFNTAPIGKPPVYGLEAWSDAWTRTGVWSSIWNTLKVTFWYQLIAFPVGVVLAWVIARSNLPWARGFEVLFWLSFFLPTLATTLGWQLLLDPQLGALNRLAKSLGFDQGPFNAYSFEGIIWVHLMSHAISSKVMLLAPAFRNMDSALEESARISGAGPLEVFRKITLPALTPALIIVFMLGVVRVFESFEIELLLGVPFDFYVFSTRIVDLVRSEPPLIAQASALGSLTLLILVVVMPVQRWITTRRDYTTVTSRMRPTPVDLGRWRWPVFAAVSLLVGLLVAVPIASVVAGSFMTRFGFFDISPTWTLANWRLALTDTLFTSSIRNTLIIAAIAGVVGPAIFAATAYVVVRARHVKGRALLDFILWTPSVVPGALAGLGLLWVFLGTPLFRPLYGTLTLLVIATVIGGVTISTQLLKAGLLQLSVDLEEAASMSGAGKPRIFFRIVVPLIMPTVIVVAALNFLFAANATSSIILLATSRSRPLSLLTLDFVAEGLRESACVTTIMITALTMAAALLARRFGRGGLGRM